MKNRLSITLLLMLVPLFWALTFPFIRISVHTISPDSFVFWRFTLAALFLLGFSLQGLKQLSGYLVYWGIVLGILNCGTFLFQTIGLETISSARAAFITGSSVVLVPALSFLLRLAKPTKVDVVAALICLLGLYLVTGASVSQLVVGNFWVLACAIATALSIIIIQKITPHIKDNVTFTFLQIVFTLPLLLLHHQQLWDRRILQDRFILISIVFCAIFATAIALLLQLRLQKYTTECKAALIFSTEPIFATIFASLFFHEPVTLPVIIGGAVIFFSIIASEIYQLCRKTPLFMRGI